VISWLVNPALTMLAVTVTSRAMARQKNAGCDAWQLADYNAGSAIHWLNRWLWLFTIRWLARWLNQ